MLIFSDRRRHGNKNDAKNNNIKRAEVRREIYFGCSSSTKVGEFK